MEARPQHHEMLLMKVHESGVEEWHCPTCGRRFLMQWPPDYRKIILEAGDESAIHSGGKTAMNQAAPEPAQDPVSLGEEKLEPFLHWMEQIHFAELWRPED